MVPHNCRLRIDTRALPKLVDALKRAGGDKVLTAYRQRINGKARYNNL